MIIKRLAEKEHLMLYLASAVFIALHAFLVLSENFILSALPLLIIIIWLAFHSLDKLLILTVFLVPFSIELSYLAGGRLDFDFSIPAEILLAGISILFILKYLRGQKPDIRIFKHPVTMAIFFYLAWIFITSLTSNMPLVSFKFLISRIWFIIPFYLLAIVLFREQKKIRQYIYACIIPLVFIIAWTIVRHAGYGLTAQQVSHLAVKPFYNDHTAYGALLAMLIPVLIGLFHLFFHKMNTWMKMLSSGLIAYFILAILFSYSRAAWVSLLAAGLIWIIIKLRIPWTIFFAFVLLTGFALFSFKPEIVMNLERNQQASSVNFMEHTLSIYNITNDDSNVERINRWKCAIRMFSEKPVFGWGPGTYMFLYAPFQVSSEKTNISTNAGTAGNAHSEYLGPLAESGLPGALSIFLIFILTVITGFRVHFKTRKRKIKILSLAILLGLITYYVHGMLNNFLDTDKISVVFWGFTAILIAMDIYHVRKYQGKEIQFPEN